MIYYIFENGAVHIDKDSACKYVWAVVTLLISIFYLFSPTLLAFELIIQYNLLYK